MLQGAWGLVQDGVRVLLVEAESKLTGRNAPSAGAGPALVVARFSAAAAADAVRGVLQYGQWDNRGPGPWPPLTRL